MVRYESALISCIAQDPAVIGGEVLSAFRQENPFTSNHCRRVYHSWASQPDRNEWNTITIVATCEAAEPAVDWLTEVRAIVNTEPSVVHWRKHLSAVVESYNKRSAKLILEQAVHELEQKPSTVVLQEAVRALNNIGTESEQEQSVEDAMAKEMERRRNESLVVRTGFEKLDCYLGPLVPGEILLLAARPSCGKSVVAHNIARYLGEHGVPTGMFSLEMPIPQVVARMISASAEYDSRMVLDNMHNQEVERAYDHIRRLPVYYDDRAGLYVAQIVNKIRRWSVNHGIKAVILDYVQLVRSQKKQNEAIGDTLKEIKAVCAELGIVPIILAQINRAGAKNESGKPSLEDIKGSGSLEEDSSYVVLMHREVLLSNEQRTRVENGGSVELEVAVAKNRHGSTGYNRLSFTPKFCLVTDRRMETEEIPK